MRTEVFEQCRMDIRIYLVDVEDFHTSIRMLLNLYNKLINESKQIKFQMHYVLYNLGYCFKKIHEYNKSIELLEESLKYTSGNIDVNYSRSLWMMATVYSEISDNKRSNNIYIKLAEYHKKNNNEADRMIMMLNVAHLHNSIQRMCLITDHLVEELINNNNTTNANKEKMHGQILEMVEEVKNNSKLTNDNYYYNKIIIRLNKLQTINNRKNLLTQQG